MKSYFMKLALFCIIISLLIFVYNFCRDTVNTGAVFKKLINVSNNTNPFREEISTKKENTSKINMKYILQWTSSSNVPFADMGKGQKGFIDRKCPHTNCFVTSNKSYLGDYTKFDVVAFSGPDLAQWIVYNITIPERRSPHQKYVFGSIESPHYYPVCKPIYNDFFNWTWTFKLDSEVQWGFVVVRDLKNNIIGPKKNMNWLRPEEMMPVSDEFKKKLKTKRKAAAWFVSNCVSRSKREIFVWELQMELGKYRCADSACTVDVYGQCGPFKCSRDQDEMCNRNIAATYYFYLSFENSFSEDYVTEKLLRALQNNAVPIVFGGANYSRFLPDGAYLDAMKLDAVSLAAKMHELINYPEEYASYFKWKNHYYYHSTTSTVETNEYCRFCALLNNEHSVKEESVYNDFLGWWNPGICNQVDKNTVVKLNW